MEFTTYNPQKGRLETLEVEFTAENTTWFENSGNADCLNYHGLQRRNSDQKDDYTYPVWLYDISRADIDFSKKKAKELMQSHE